MRIPLIFTFTVIELSLFILFFKLQLKRRSYLVIGIIAFIIFHLIPLFLFKEVESDISFLREVPRILFSGKDIYSVSSYPDYYPSYPRYTPYFPFWVYFVALADSLAIKLMIPYAILIKIPGVLANLGIALLIYKYAKVWGIKTALKEKLFALYLLNPAPTLIATYQGHWDTVVLFFLILGLVMFLTNKKVVSGLIFSLATLIKPWPIIFMPLLLVRIKSNSDRLKFISIYSLPLLLSMITYSLFVNTSFIRIIKAIFLYQSLAGWWGISFLVFAVGKRLFSHWNLTIILNASKWLLGSLLIAVSFLRKVKVTQLMLLLILLIFVFTPGLSIHYLVWIVPLALLIQDIKNYFFFSILASIFLLFTFTFMIFPDSAPFIIPRYLTGLTINLLAILVWGYCLYWLFDLTKKQIL